MTRTFRIVKEDTEELVTSWLNVWWAETWKWFIYKSSPNWETGMMGSSCNCRVLDWGWTLKTHHPYTFALNVGELAPVHIRVWIIFSANHISSLAARGKTLSCFWRLFFLERQTATNKRKHEGQHIKMKIKNLLYPSVLGFPTMCCAFLHERNYIVIYRLILYSFTQSMKVYLCMRVVIHLTRLQVWQNLDLISKGFRFPFYWVEIVCSRCDVWQHWPTSNLSTCVTKGEEIAVIAYRDAGTHKSLSASLSLLQTHTFLWDFVVRLFYPRT